MPGDATPEQVVAYVERLEQTTQFLEIRDKLCGVLVRRARGQCLSDPPRLLDPPRRYVRAVEEPNRVVLTTRDGSDRLIAVRLERSPAGWELVDVPPDFADYTCFVTGRRAAGPRAGMAPTAAAVGPAVPRPAALAR